MAGNVLFVDDEPHVTAGLARLVRRQSYNVFTANHLAAALDILMLNEIDVVITDERMPGIKGVEFLEKLKVDHPEVVRIMLTGVASLETALEAINRGEVYRFLTKPCNQIDLISTINNALEYKQLVGFSRRLLHLSKQQQCFLQQLEKQYPGISQVERDATGVVLISDSSPSTESLLQELNEQIDHLQQNARYFSLEDKN